uniref:Uncharacterized protein n=1 Tax=Noctiluca scintillans TaxID=2966 RepID=A0A7S1AHC5_NOCSC|mmetsp:Transcript_46296/g.122900  ORF Transcript_46296/g.122900 Transcript_46296/m.122900 type:complete len:389 (+) Transcript_46296:48-1214(+)
MFRFLIFTCWVPLSWSADAVEDSETKACLPSDFFDPESDALSMSLLQFDKKRVHGIHEKWEVFKAEHGKVYLNAEEELLRFASFVDNLDRAAHIDEGDALYGASMFSDMHASEFSDLFLGLPNFPSSTLGQWLGAPTWSAPSAPARYPEFEKYVSGKKILTSLDWRQYGAVTAVKNQGLCGSCWAFSAIGDVEGSWFLRGNELMNLSEQLLVSCDTQNSGCSGGWPFLAFEKLMVSGAFPMTDYPYNDATLYGTTTKCLNEIQPSLTVDVLGYVFVSVLNYDDGETRMMHQIIAGPMSIVLNATAMQLYLSGVSKPKECGSDISAVNHAVLAVGFGVELGDPYWLIKNSWSASWGESGYYRIFRGLNMCALATVSVTTSLPEVPCEDR